MTFLFCFRMFCIYWILGCVTLYFTNESTTTLSLQWLALWLVITVVAASKNLKSSAVLGVCAILLIAGLWNAYLLSNFTFYQIGAYLWGAASFVGLIGSFFESRFKTWAKNTKL